MSEQVLLAHLIYGAFNHLLINLIKCTILTHSQQNIGRKLASQFKPTNGTRLDMRRVSSEIVTTPTPNPQNSPPEKGKRNRANTFTNGGE